MNDSDVLTAAPDPHVDRLFTPTLMALLLGAALSISAEELPYEMEWKALDEPSTEASVHIELDDGQALDITFSEAQINYIPIADTVERSTLDSISLALLQNPQLSSIFVPGLFSPPAAGGPVYEEAQRARNDEREAALYDPNKLATLETSVAAALLFRQYVEVRIEPQFQAVDFDATTIVNTPRP
ncbi:hypothetical protein [Hahella sp. HN01]|uniref:hypothetical protein n=1 Tax=Hahella sp. HN01 TaxID=2847262 RepID=UPI001C1EA3A7|nr:hypothetical protein [Hahella sp. HN01]MBU6952179.1 hypothetical protein [Hahella sp. HN01]